MSSQNEIRKFNQINTNTQTKHPSILEKSAMSCVKCAKCVPTCTIYGVNRDEITSPRGYLDLANAYAKGRLLLDKQLKDSIESCFLCTTCVEQCPMHLPVDVVIQRTRVDIAKQYGIPLYKKIMFYLLGKRSVLNIVFSMGYYFNPCLFKTQDGFKKMRFKIPKIGDRAIMPLNAKSFLQSHNGLIESRQKQNDRKRKVGIYIGCLSNYNYKNVGVSLLKILDKLGIDVLVPKKQECCGAPAFFSGDIRNTTKLIKKNLNYLLPLLEDLEALLIPEATCAAMLLHDWHNALEIESEVYGNDNSEYIAKLKILEKKTHMASKWLHDHTHLNELLQDSKKEDRSITYHDPCHARKVLQIYKEPRQLLQNFKLKEMKDYNVCCGFGGVTIQSEKYDLAKSVGDKKAVNIQQSGADIVSAECSACRMQIDDSMARNKVNVAFRHPLELIAENLSL
ncbi:(Fe-S)-binding protein [Helicobacter trogontum]|uniref:Glycolate oxidase iron-sulfur subunit n=1 Tax=Helicobacter trogontum TaxID=50960 RepID=A0A4U8SDD3_9HELI|nr:(Fe-S)-binding protein [Helicobacter trogontum]TLD84116.1 (Fe-S)-binding protein [Helicobacter trogontum]